MREYNLKYNSRRGDTVDWILVFIELIFEGICDGWFYLMQWIVPDKMANKRFRMILKILVGIFSIGLLITTLIGLVIMFSNDEQTKGIGKYMVFVPLVISVLQILVGIITRKANKKKL